jgi:hypothetical protein
MLCSVLSPMSRTTHTEPARADDDRKGRDALEDRGYRVIAITAAALACRADRPLPGCVLSSLKAVTAVFAFPTGSLAV